MSPTPCPACQSPIPKAAPAGLCPTCVLRGAAQEAQSFARGAPSLDEIATAFPKIEVLECIGQGGMGFVYKVRQPDLDRIVALKILSPELSRDPTFAERFTREARTLAKLHHPNIVTIFEHGQSGGHFYLLMEYVKGMNLRQLMRAGRFSPEQALAIVPGICDALQAAHGQGIWHRDIKPENILLDHLGKVKIVDFGIALIAGDPRHNFTLTATGNALGSAAYMAPEQHEKPHQVDHRADIYSLGVVIYEMLTGELPLGRFPLPSQRAAVSARIDDIVLQTLEKERELRQQSAEQVKTEFGSTSPSPTPGEGNTASAPLPPATATRRVVASVGMLVGGLALAGAGMLVSGFAFVIGAAFSAIGFAGCLWSLYDMKRVGFSGPVRWLLISLTIIPLCIGAFILTINYASEPFSLRFKGGVLLLAATAFGMAAGMYWLAMLLGRSSAVTTRKSRWLAAGSMTLAVTSSAFGILQAKRIDGHWPYSGVRESATIKWDSASSMSDEEILQRLQKASGKYVDDYEFSIGNSQIEATVYRSSNSPNVEEDPFDYPSKHLGIVYQNFIHGLTADQFPTTLPRPAIEMEDRPTDSGLLTAQVVLPLALGALFACLVGGAAFWIHCGSVLVMISILAMLPAWPQGSESPRIVPEPPVSLHSDVRVAGTTSERWSITETSNDGPPSHPLFVEGTLTSNTSRGGRYGALTYHAGSHPLFVIIKQDHIHSHHWGSQLGRTWGWIDSVRYLFDENESLSIGERVYDLKQGRTFFQEAGGTIRQLLGRPEKVLHGPELLSFVESLRASIVMIDTLEAARNGNMGLFGKGLSSSFRAVLEKEGGFQDGGDFAHAAFVGVDLVDEQTADAVVRTNTQPFVRFTIRMIIEEGEWKITEHGL